jgi:hypothetical protein
VPTTARTTAPSVVARSTCWSRSRRKAGQRGRGAAEQRERRGQDGEQHGLGGEQDAALRDRGDRGRDRPRGVLTGDEQRSQHAERDLAHGDAGVGLQEGFEALRGRTGDVLGGQAGADDRADHRQDEQHRAQGGPGGGHRAGLDPLAADDPAELLRGSGVPRLDGAAAGG